MDSNWLAGPCAFQLPRKSATECCACGEAFCFTRRGDNCEFCGRYCHKSCSRKIWLACELLRRRICSRCDCYRKISSTLRRGTDFTFHNGSSSDTSVTLSVDETTGSLLIQERSSGQTLDCVGLSRLEAVRRGFSLSGRLRTSTYDPLRSLSLTVNNGSQNLATYNLTTSSAFTCQRWVDGLQAAMYVQRRLEDQELAREWYLREGRSLHTPGSRLLHNHLPSNNDLRKLRQERNLGRTPPISSLVSNDSGVDVLVEGSVEDQDLLESYIDIELTSGGEEVMSREICLSALFGKSLSLSCPATPAIPHSSSRRTSPSRIPTSSSDFDIARRGKTISYSRTKHLLTPHTPLV